MDSTFPGDSRADHKSLKGTYAVGGDEDEDDRDRATNPTPEIIAANFSGSSSLIPSRFENETPIVIDDKKSREVGVVDLQDVLYLW